MRALVCQAGGFSQFLVCGGSNATRRETKRHVRDPFIRSRRVQVSVSRFLPILGIRTEPDRTGRGAFQSPGDAFTCVKHFGPLVLGVRTEASVHERRSYLNDAQRVHSPCSTRSSARVQGIKVHGERITPFTHSHERIGETNTPQQGSRRGDPSLLCCLCSPQIQPPSDGSHPSLRC